MQAFRDRTARVSVSSRAPIHWLAILRVGLGLEVTLYSLSLRNDWTYLLSGTVRAKWRKHCFLWKAILSRDSDGLLLWRHNLAYMRRQYSFWHGLVCLLPAAVLLSELPPGSQQLQRGFLHLCAAKSGGFVSYGMDNFMTIGLFYLMLSPLPDRYSLDWRLRKSQPKNPQLLGFWRRVLQLHLCIIYFFSGLTKCLGRGWWNGSSVWRALIRPPFNVIDPEILVRWKYLFPVAGIFICLLGNRISVFYLEQQDTKDLAARHVRNARRDRSNHGNVPFLARHDRSQPGRVRDGFVCADETNPFTA